MEPVVEIRALSVSFSGRPVLREINASFLPGQISVIIGPSGSGKTTLLRGINRLNELFPGCLTTGSVRLKLGGRWGEAYGEGMDVAVLRRRAAMVFQTPHVLPVSIEKNFSVPLKVTLHLSKRDARDRMERSLREAELFDEVKDRLRHSALTLSGGQQQRLCLARALALDPEILLLDEPTASLDFRATRRIEELLLRLKDRYTIIAVSHSLGQTSRLADQCLILRDGVVAERADRAALHDPAHIQRMVEEIL